MKPHNSSAKTYQFLVNIGLFFGLSIMIEAAKYGVINDWSCFPRLAKVFQCLERLDGDYVSTRELLEALSAIT